MSDQQTTPTTGDQQAQQPATNQQQQPQQPAQGPVPYERFKEVNAKAQELEARLAKIEADKKAAGEQKLKDDGKLQELLATRERELADERAAALRLKVAMAKGLTGELAPLASRLQGTTEAELSADADALLAVAKKPAGAGVPPPGAGGRPANQVDLNSMTPAQIREALAKGQIKLQ